MSSMAADPLTSRTVDDLLDDVDFFSDDDPFADRPAKTAERDDNTAQSPRKRKAPAEEVFGNNVDEEIKITKQRKKIPKLDAERLLSEPGIPKIRSLVRSGRFKNKLRLRGKGHEFTDVAKLLNYYQIWLDQLYPRAKFADAIQLVERAGHTKKMQMYRKSWIDEGKPGFVRREEVDKAVEMQDIEQRNTQEQSAAAIAQSQPPLLEDDPALMFFGNDDARDVPDSAGPDDDELEALMAQEYELTRPPSEINNVQQESEGEDDLDALLAEQDNRATRLTVEHQEQYQGEVDTGIHAKAASLQQQVAEKDSQRSSNAALPIEADDEDDELDALLNEDSQPGITNSISIPGNDESDLPGNDLDGLDPLLATERRAAQEPELPSLAQAMAPSKKPAYSSADRVPGSEEVPELDNVISSSPIPNVRTDELDDLLDEHEEALKHKNADSGIVEGIVSSSPIPNEES